MERLWNDQSFRNKFQKEKTLNKIIIPHNKHRKYGANLLGGKLLTKIRNYW